MECRPSSRKSSRVLRIAARAPLFTRELAATLSELYIPIEIVYPGEILGRWSKQAGSTTRLPDSDWGSRPGTCANLGTCIERLQALRRVFVVYILSKYYVVGSEKAYLLYIYAD